MRTLETYVNLTWGFPWWELSIDSWMRRAGHSIDIIGLDYYPGTWAIARPDDWNPLKGIIRKITDPSDPCYGKKAAVQETGFATFFYLFHGEQDQREWINVSLPALKTIISAHNSRNPNKVVSCCWYELIDADTPGVIWPEPYFGILRHDWSKKAGYLDLKARIGEF